MALGMCIRLLRTIHSLDGATSIQASGSILPRGLFQRPHHFLPAFPQNTYRTTLMNWTLITSTIGRWGFDILMPGRLWLRASMSPYDMHTGTMIAYSKHTERIPVLWSSVSTSHRCCQSEVSALNISCLHAPISFISSACGLMSHGRWLPTW